MTIIALVGITEPAGEHRFQIVQVNQFLRIVRRQVSDEVERNPDIDDLDRADVIERRTLDEAALGQPHGDRDVRVNGRPLGDAAIGVEPRRNVDGHDERVAALRVDILDGAGRRPARRPGAADAEDAVHDDIRGIRRVSRLVPVFLRRKLVHRYLRRLHAAEMLQRIVLDFIRRAGQPHRDIEPHLLELPRRGKRIAAVVPAAGDDMNQRVVEIDAARQPAHRIGDSETRAVHQDFARCPGLLDRPPIQLPHLRRRDKSHVASFPPGVPTSKAWATA